MAGTLIVSLDFELFWGMLEVCPLEEYQEHVLGGRKAIPQMLELFQKYGIHATWAAVGFLFARDYAELQRYFPQNRPTYQDLRLDPYKEFLTIGSNEETAPCFYGASLVEQVAKAPGQELGSHTFCHYYCRAEGQTAEQFAADMRSAKDIARDHGAEIKSVILPRNQCTPEHTQVLRELGFTSYRDEENDWVHRKMPLRILKRLFTLMDAYLPITGLAGSQPRLENGIWNLTGSKMYRPEYKPLWFLEWLKMARIKAQIRYAAKHNLVYHLWWHPHNLGVKTEFHLEQLEEIFACFDQMRQKYGMQSMSMGEFVEAQK